MKKYIFAAAKNLLHNLCALHASAENSDFETAVARPVIIFLRAYGYAAHELEEFVMAGVDHLEARQAIGEQLAFEAAYQLDCEMNHMG